MKRAVTIGLFCTAGLLVLLCGCAAPTPEKQLFDRVAAELDSGGSYYTIQNTFYLKKALKNLRKNAEAQLWHLPIPPQKKEHYQLILSSAELLFHTTGLSEIEAVGSSSCRVGEKQFKNTVFLALPPKTQGVFWQSLPKENSLSLHELENLPHNTTLAGVVRLNPQSLEQKLKSLYPQAQAFFAFPLLKEMSGSWRFALIVAPAWDAQTGRGVHAMLAIPDPQKKVFNQIAGILQMMPGAKIDRKNSKIALPPLPRVVMNTCGLHEKGTLFLFSSPQDAELFRNPPKKLKTRADFQSAAAVLNRPCLGAFYADSTQNLNRILEGRHLECGFDDLCIVSLLERKKTGLKWSSCVPCDWNVAALQSLLVPVAMLLEPLLLEPEPQAEAQEKENQQNFDEDIPPLNPAKCEKHLKTLYNALNSYKKAHKKFPSQAGLEGLRELIKQKYITEEQLICPAMDIYSPALCGYTDCVYLYFGIPESPESPLLMERPVNHGRPWLSVLLANGTVKSFFMEKPFGVRKAVSFLHTQYHYEEKEFMRLMELAAEFDKILGLRAWIKKKQ